MSCNTKGLSKKKKIILFSSVGSGMAAVSYLTFTTTSNPAIAATIPALLPLAACPVMCVGMGGIMWFMNRLSKNKNKNKNNQMDMIYNRAGENKEEKEDSCCVFPQTNKLMQNVKHKHTSNEDSAMKSSYNYYNCKNINQTSKSKLIFSC